VGQYVIRRIFLFIPTMLLTTVIVFVLFFLVPGDAALFILTGEEGAGAVTDADLDKLREELGLNRPIHVQYGSWVWGLLRGDMGTSIWYKTPVVDELKDKFAVTLQLAIMGIVLAFIIAVPLGMISAVKQDTWPDYASRIFTLVGIALPTFWLAILIVYFLAYTFDWLPPLGYATLWEDPWLNLQQLIFPAIAIALHDLAFTARITRSAMLEVLDTDYVKFAQVKGLPDRIVIWKHATRNALIPVLTFGGIALAGLLYVAWQYQSAYEQWSFAIGELTAFSATHLSGSEQAWVLLALLAGFAVKVPLFPLHTWLPLAHTEAPTAGSVVLAGVLLKLGTYGLYRFVLPMVPEAVIAYAPAIGVISIIGILYAALICWVQDDIKRLVAYSSVSHLGFCVLGLFSLNPLGLQGSVIYMLNHGLSTGALFFLVGMIYERYHTRDMSKLSGLSARMPVWAFFMVFFVLSSVGLPGLNGFIGEFLCLLGAFTASADNATHPGLLGPWYAAVAALGMIFAAMYLLIMTGKVVFGPLKEPAATNNSHGAKLPADLTFREIGVLVPLAVLCLYIGFQPKPLTDALHGPITQVLAVYPETVRQHLAENAPVIDERDRVILTMTETDSDRNKGADDG